MSWFDTLAWGTICLVFSSFALSWFGAPEKRTRGYAPLVTALLLPAFVGLGFHAWRLVSAVTAMPLGQLGTVQVISLMEHPGPAMVQRAVLALLGLVIAYGFLVAWSWLFGKVERRLQERGPLGHN